MVYRIAYATDVDGRKGQEDCLFVDGEVVQAGELRAPGRAVEAGGLLLAVCDGMGGHEAGDWASRFVCEALRAAGPGVPATPEEVRDLLRGIQDAIVRAGGPNGGTTVAGVALREGRAVVFNAGDSRVYKSGPGGLVRLSHDHSLVQGFVDRGEISPEEAFDHPHRNVIDFGLGELFDASWALDPVPVHAVADTLRAGESYLICSDGVHDVLRDAEIADLLAGGAVAPEAALSRALRGRMVDNTSFILVSAPPPGAGAPAA